MTTFFIILILIMLCITIHAIWSRRKSWVRFSSLVLLTAGLVVVWIALVDLLGRPKPIILERMNIDEADVIAAVIEEGMAIYLWLQIPNVNVPRAYLLKWDRDVAEELQKAMFKAKQRGTGVKIRLPFGELQNQDTEEDRIDSYGYTTRFYAIPQRPPPLKVPSSPLIMQ